MYNPTKGERSLKKEEGTNLGITVAIGYKNTRLKYELRCDEEYLCLRLCVDHADDLDLDVVAVAPEPVLLDLDLGRV